MSGRRSRLILVTPEIRASVIAIVGNQIAGLVHPVRIDARLGQDLGLSDDARRRIERGVERRFGVPAMGAGGSWHTVEDVANFVALRLRRHEGIARVTEAASLAGLTDQQRKFRSISPFAPLPWQVGAEEHGGNVAVYDALGMELLIVGEWSGMTDQEAAAIATAIVEAANTMGGVRPAEHAEASSVGGGD